VDGPENNGTDWGPEVQAVFGDRPDSVLRDMACIWLCK
jgi:hypothetical protein